MNLLYYKYFKRIIDIVVAFIVLIVFSPLLCMIAVLIKMKLGSPTFFIQNRPGQNEKLFKIIKFRTMTNNTDKQSDLLPNNLRRTKFGDFLRKTSIDELPEFYNVFIGEMSLVGPRPLETRYLPLYNEYQKQRHNVKPGITGWAQVNGRNSISWDEKFEMDVWYVNNVSFFLDIRIFFLTVYYVLKRKGINSDETNSVIPFDEYLTSK